MNNKFEWLPTECADRKYPMEILKGTFTSSDGQSVTIPDGRFLFNGWANVGSIHIVGEAQKSIPNKLDITWFSFTENMFFKGTFDLPEADIYKLFTEGYINPNDGKKEKYEMIMVGLAPGGFVSVWVYGPLATRLVATYSAQVTTVDWDTFVTNPDYPREKYIRVNLEQVYKAADFDTLKIRGVVKGIFDKKYNASHNWRAVFVSSAKAKSIFTTYFNGERVFDTFSTTDSILKPLVGKMPKNIDLVWELNGQSYITGIEFDETELSNAFAQMEQDKPLNLQFELNSVSKFMTVALANDSHIYDFKLCDIKTYPIRN